MSFIFVGLPFFYLATENSKDSLTIGVTIDDAESIEREYAADFSEYFLWKVLRGLQSC